MAKKKSRAQQAFELIVATDADKARLRLKKYSTDLKRLTKDEKTFIRQAQKRAATLRATQVPAPGSTTVASRAHSRFRVTRSNKNFAIGAEGVRIGHLRFNQAGRFSFSERTFLRSGTVLAGAIGGQILGNLGEATVRIRDEIRSGRDPTKIITQYTKDQVGRILQMAGQLFGITKLATSVHALLSGVSWEEAEKGMTDVGLLFLGSEDAILKRAAEAGAEEAVIFNKHRTMLLKSRRRARARDLLRWPQDTETQMEVIREDLAVRESDERLMVRDITNVPLWKRVRLSLNEGA